jgi:phosphoribosylglycinamide formyltransferase-1
MKKNIVVLISGRGSNLESIISATNKNNFPAKISLVISSNKAAKGLKIAEKNYIENFIIEQSKFSNNDLFEEALIGKIIQHDPSLVCLAGFMIILSKNFINKFRGKIINIHPSLLPDYKGLNTHKRAIIAGEKYSGCTVHYVTEELDGGKIIAQEKVSISPSDTPETLGRKVLEKEHIIYPKTIDLLLR